MKAYVTLMIRRKWISFFLPLVTGCIILCISSNYYCDLYTGDYETIHLYVIPNFHLICTLLSVWWTILFFSGFISKEGNELIYMYFSSGRVVVCQLFLNAFYIACLFILFLCVQDLYRLPVSLFCLLAVESFFMNAAAFFLIQWMKNTSLALTCVTVYTVFLIKFDQMRILGVISIFPEPETAGKISLWRLLIEMGAGIVFYMLGEVCFWKRKGYD